MKIFLTLFLFSLPLLSETPENITSKNEQVGEMCFTTIDINVTEDWLKK